ncbi:MAG: NUDIX hydrolase [Lachnospiraceae bacterium]|nr:NUDIX hydrolase [Lachnospiraceae bacterium]
MKLLHMKKVRNGKYLKNYELTYLNKAGRKKTFELVSRKDLASPKELGTKPSGVSIVAYQDNRILLLKEFRMSINKSIFNLCAGMLEENESIEDCIHRELFEETGLQVKRIISILPPSYSAVGFSDTTTYIAFVETEGILSDNSSENELIHPCFFTKEELAKAMETEEFSSRSQMAAWFFLNGSPY